MNSEGFSNTGPANKHLRAGVIGASGYSGEELVRILGRHPKVDLVRVTSRSLAGKPVLDAMPRFRGIIPSDLAFSPSMPEALAADSDVDVWFLALPHGVAAEFAAPLVKAGRRVIDLSADFRLGCAKRYREFYGQEHPDPNLLAAAAYVIPEIAEAGWQRNLLIAAPGCYPTSVILPLYPLLAAGVVSADGIVVNSVSGISGAGKNVAENYLFCERAESVTGYGMPKHRHLAEMEAQLAAAAGKPVVIQFNPHLVPMRRGIATTIVVPAAKGDLQALYNTWENAFGNRPFVGILPSGEFPDTARVTHTNRIDISAVYDQRSGNFVICSAEDNLLKGAGGQAVQIMNLWHGMDEALGLI